MFFMLNIYSVVVVCITADNEVDLVYYPHSFDFPYYVTNQHQNHVELAKQIVYQHYQHAYFDLYQRRFPFVSRKFMKFQDDDMDVFIYQLPFGVEYIPNRLYSRIKITDLLKIDKNISSRYSEHSLYIIRQLYK